MPLAPRTAPSHILKRNPASEEPPRFTIGVCKGTALLSENRALLREWHPGESAVDLARRVRESDLLGKATAQRSADVVRRVFGPRFLRRDGEPAQYLQRLLSARGETGEWFSSICLLYAARADALVRAAVVELLAGARAEGRLGLSVASVESFLGEAVRLGKTEQPWSPEVVRKVARGVFKLLTEFGFLASAPRGRPREILRYRVQPVAVAYLAFDLHFQGCTDASLPLHPDWQLWQMDVPHVRDALDALSSRGLWMFQAAGAVVRITWNYSTMTEAINALARLDV